MLCSSAATSEPTALASLVRTASQPVVEKPGWLRLSAAAVATALLCTCQLGARSIVSAEATGDRHAQATPVALDHSGDGPRAES